MMVDKSIIYILLIVLVLKISCLHNVGNMVFFISLLEKYKFLKYNGHNKEKLRHPVFNKDKFV